MLSDERIILFLNRVCSHITWPVYCARVRRELTDHILTRAEYLANKRGFSMQEAIAQAILQLGDPDELGHTLRRAHRPFKQLGCMLTLCLLWAGIAFCAVYLFLHIPFK